MKISKFFCMLIAGLAIIGFTTVGMAEEEHPKAEATEAEATAEATEAVAEATAEATEAEITGEGEVAVKAESKEDIQYGAKSELEEGEEKAKTEEKE